MCSNKLLPGASGVSRLSLQYDDDIVGLLMPKLSVADLITGIGCTTLFPRDDVKSVFGLTTLDG